MSEGNVAQWLAEVRSLQHQVKMLQKEREEAYGSADNWRKLYESEAQQRRKDDAASRRKIDKLQQGLTESNRTDSGETAQRQTGQGASHQLEADIAAIKGTQSVQALQAQLIATNRQCAQLKERLEAEQTEHEQTRVSLTAALGDAVDLLAKERNETSKK